MNRMLDLGYAGRDTVPSTGHDLVRGHDSDNQVDVYYVY